MSTVTIYTAERPFAVRFGSHLKPMNEEEFFQFCRENPELRIERSSAGEILIMPPAGGETSNFNAKVTARLTAWAEADGSGEPFDSSGGFILPNGAERSPDFAWVAAPRWQALTRAQRQKFPPLCPDFVVEIRSPSDKLSLLKGKLREYLENGAQLGWLIDPQQKRVYVFRPGQEPQRLDRPTQVSGEPLLPGCTLELQQLWPLP